MTEDERTRGQAFLERIIDEPSEEGLAAAVAADRGGPDALRALVHDDLTGGPGFGPTRDEDLLWRFVAVACTTWRADEKQRFMDETLFAADEHAYPRVAQIVRAVMRVDEAERIVLAALERGDAPTRENASHLAYLLFDNDEDWTLSDIGRRRLRAADPHAG